MMAMGGKGDVIESLTDLHIVPLSISYEYDPCDFLKAKEFQQKRDNPDYVKAIRDMCITNPRHALTNGSQNSTAAYTGTRFST